MEEIVMQEGTTFQWLSTENWLAIWYQKHSRLVWAQDDICR